MKKGASALDAPFPSAKDADYDINELSGPSGVSRMPGTGESHTHHTAMNMPTLPRIRAVWTEKS